MIKLQLIGIMISEHLLEEDIYPVIGPPKTCLRDHVFITVSPGGYLCPLDGVSQFSRETTWVTHLQATWEWGVKRATTSISCWCMLQPNLLKTNLLHFPSTFHVDQIPNDCKYVGQVAVREPNCQWARWRWCAFRCQVICHNIIIALDSL